MSRLRGALVFVMLALPLPGDAQEPTLVIENGRVIVGDGRVLEPASVVISNDRIVGVTQQQVAAPQAERFDARGLTVLPGLIDAHVHLTIRPSITDSASLESHLEQGLSEVFDAFLRHGITTVRSTGDYWPWIGELRDRITAGEIRGPRLMVAGPVVTFQDAHPATSVCSGNPFCRSHVVAEVQSAAHARETVRRLAREGVDFIKVVSDSTIIPIQIPDDVMSSIIAQAHREGLEVVAHVAQAPFIQKAADMGLDGFVHPTLQPLSMQLARELAASLVQEGIPVTTTVSAFLIYAGVPVDLAFQPASGIRRAVEGTAAPLAVLAEEGVQLVLGTDWCACGPGSAHQALQAGSVTLTEMEMLRWGGLSAETILASATIHAARALGLGAELGTLEAGKTADLLLVAGNPLEDLTSLRNMRAVFRSGRIVAEGQP